MKPAVRNSLLAVGAALVVAVIAAFPGRLVYWESNDRIQAYLLRKTPLGASQQEVLNWLRKNGTPGKIAVVPVPPNSNFPPTSIGGESFIQESVANYWLVFRTDIEAFYIFDSRQKLVDLSVRATTDAL